MTQLIDPRHRLLESASGFAIERSQELPTSFLDRLADERHATSNRPCGDLHKFASIPTAVVDKWAREGFDILKHKYSAKEIMTRLERENLGAFITTTKVL